MVFFSPKTWKLAFQGSLLLWLSFPPLDLWPLAWIAPLPWIMLIRRTQLEGRRPYMTLTAAGFAFWMGALHWLRLPHWATSFGWVGLSFYFAFYLPLFVGLSRVAVHRLHVPAILAAPIVWTGLELARAHLLTGMSMASLSHTQYRWIALIQMSDLAGEYGVSFVVMFVAASLARMLPCEDNISPLSLRERVRVRAIDRIRAFWPLLPAAAMLAAAVLYGQARIETNSTKAGPRIALIQGSIDVKMQSDPDMRERIFKEYFDLSFEAVKENHRLDLVVWPESMFPEPLLDSEANARFPQEFQGTEAEFREMLQEAANRKRERMAPPLMAKAAGWLKVPLLLDTESDEFGPETVRSYNSAVFIARDGRLLGRYDKMHLVVFGEYVPFAGYFPWLQNLTPLPISATPGDKPAVFDCRGFQIAPNICYESVLSHVIRGQVNSLAAEGREPDILVNLTNDGWFWGSSELDMHLVCGIFRAVECRKPFLIAANTGFSAWIDSDGRIQQQGPRRAKQVLIAEPRLDEHRRSWYLEHGDWFAGACLVFCVICGLAGGLSGGLSHFSCQRK